MNSYTFHWLLGANSLNSLKRLRLFLCLIFSLYCVLGFVDLLEFLTDLLEALPGVVECNTFTSFEGARRKNWPNI